MLVIKKPMFNPKEYSLKHFKALGSRFAKFNADTLLEFLSHHNGRRAVPVHGYKKIKCTKCRHYDTKCQIDSAGSGVMTFSASHILVE